MGCSISYAASCIFGQLAPTDYSVIGQAAFTFTYFSVSWVYTE